MQTRHRLTSHPLETAVEATRALHLALRQLGAPRPQALELRRRSPRLVLLRELVTAKDALRQAGFPPYRLR